MQGPPANAQETASNNIIRELVETERKYVQDLEHMQVSAFPCPVPPRELASSRRYPGLDTDSFARLDSDTRLHSSQAAPSTRIRSISYSLG